MQKLGVALLFIGVVALVGGSRLMRLHNPNATKADTKADLYLEAQTGLEELSRIITDSLHAVGDENEFKWAANLLGWRTYQPGHYTIDEGLTYDEFLSKLARGIQDPIPVTIVPGQPEDRILSFLSERMRFDSTALYQSVNDSSFLQEQGISDSVFVGRLFPATYDLYWTAPPRKVLERILDEFDKQVSVPLSKKAEDRNMSLNEVLALASIVEWEAIHADEKSRISGLYWNRLNRGMLLQADPTVSYALGEQRRLYNKDYKIDHPYNTYIHKGLPPGPVNNPSLSSIKAALEPTEHDFIYMVARPDGYHAFTKTYAQHRQKSAEWREYLEKMEQSEPEDPVKD
jgi:UPF0755 protein